MSNPISKPTAPKPKKKKSSSINWRQTLIVGTLAIAAMSMILPNLMSWFNLGASSGSASIPSNGAGAPSSQPTEMPDPKFTKEGVLSFASASGAPIKTIDIEKADNDMERQFGLMYRRSMDDAQGMLFLFDKSEPQAFWMRNTIIPLDIMFVDENQVITTIHENAKPMNDNSLPSKGDAKYVVEVNAGFAKKYGVKEGDKITWE